MKTQTAYIVASSAILVFVGASFAEVINTYPFWDGNVTNGYEKVAQSFVAPTDNTLDNYMFGFDVSGVSITFTVVEWDENSGPTSGALFTDNFVSVAGDNLIDNMGLTLNEGSMYATIIDMNGYIEESVHWMSNVDGNPDGDGSWYAFGTWRLLNSGFSTKFRAEFVPAPGALALFGIAGLCTRRRRG